MSQSRRLSTRLPDDLWVELEKQAKKKNITISEIVKRVLVKDLLENKIVVKRRERW